jgi:hypothetical protein
MLHNLTHLHSRSSERFLPVFEEQLVLFCALYHYLQHSLLTSSHIENRRIAQSGAGESWHGPLFAPFLPLDITDHLGIGRRFEPSHQVDKSAALHKASLFKQHINVVCARFSLFSSVSFRACIMQVAFIASQIPTASLSLFDPHQQVPRPPGIEMIWAARFVTFPMSSKSLFYFFSP